MYKFFYNMEKEPFENYPSTKIFYSSHVHHDAWKYLAQGIKRKDPVLFVAGEYGTGKTLLCLKLVKVFINKKSIPFVFVPTPDYSFFMVLRKIISVLNISYDDVKHSADESELIGIIYEYFEELDDINGKYIYIIIDEAQDISYSFANKLKLLTSFNCREHFPFKIIIFGHMDFLKILNQRNLWSLKQRVKKVFYLEPFGFNETKEYIYFRLIYSGASGSPVFDDAAIHMIQDASSGIPRLINNICDNCLAQAGRKKINYINRKIVEDVLSREIYFGKENIVQRKTVAVLGHDEPLESATSVRIQAPAESETPAESEMHMKSKISLGAKAPPEPEKIPETGRKVYAAYDRESDGDNRSSGSFWSGKFFDKRVGLIFVLILIVIILSYILFMQIKSEGVPVLNKKIGSNFMSNNNNHSLCYSGHEAGYATLGRFCNVRPVLKFNTYRITYV